MISKIDDSVKGVIKKINLSSGNFETTTIVGDNSLGPDVDQRGNTAGGPGVGQVSTITDFHFFPNNSNMILVLSSSSLRTVDLTTSTVSDVLISESIDSFDFHPTGNYIIAVRSIGNAPLIKINVKNKKQLGSDRIANAIGAKKFKNCLVLDFGTATTFDVIKNGRYSN